MFYVEHAHWVDGQGWSYNTNIDNVEKPLTAEELKEGYGDYCLSVGDEIRLYDENDNKIAVYEKTE